LWSVLASESLFLPNKLSPFRLSFLSFSYLGLSYGRCGGTDILVNSTIFKADPKKEEVKVAECLVVKLENAPEGKGEAGLWATELRVYMDFGAIHMKGKELMDLAKQGQ
jgi:hypothetical protein